MIEVRPVRLELSQIALREVDALRIEHFQVAVQKLAGDGLIKWLPGIVEIGEHVGGGARNLAVDRTGSYRVEDVGEQGRSGRQGGLSSMVERTAESAEHSGTARERLRISSEMRPVIRSIVII